jgi:hypothetical protein
MGADPVSMGLMVAASIFQGAQQSHQLNQAANADDVDAQRTLTQGAFEQEAIRRQERATSGEAIAAEAADGVSVGTGSALDLLFQNAREREYAVLVKRYSAGSQADSLYKKANQERSAAKGAMFGGLLRAGAQALTGVGEMNNASDLYKAQMGGLPGGSKMPLPGGIGAKIGY